MANLDYARREITYKIVYYGTGLGGKTTNLKYLYSQLAPEVRGELVSVASSTERTLFFDFLPVELGSYRDFKTRLAIYTVPGQLEYNQSRKLILHAVDGIIFVADSSEERSEANQDSIANMVANLEANKLVLAEIPWVLQYNKRDLVDAMPIERLEKELNFAGVPSFASVALEGTLSKH
jgi:hypothetical protein